jgi:membrane fusion protein, multidrug efflux system
MMQQTIRAAAAALLIAGALSACGKDDGGRTANAAQPGGGGPAGGGRGGPVVTLATSDVATVGRSSLEEGIAITGDLRPIETIAIRARIEGDVERVLVREGESVRAGQLLAVFESIEQEVGRASAAADLEAARNEVETALWTQEQNEQLFKAGAISARELRTSQQSLATAKARLAAAEARARTTGMTVRDTRVLAPTNGIIERRSVQTGEHVARGAAMFTLVRGDVLELAASVPSRSGNLVRAGQTVRFAADGRSFDGRVARVSPTIDPTSRAITVYVQVPNANGQLKGGTFATGRVVSRAIPQALTVPTAALRQSAGSGQPFVYRIGAQNTVEQMPVRVGVVDERLAIAEILDGLKEGDRVIVGNVGTLGRGMKVVMAGGGEGRRAQ